MEKFFLIDDFIEDIINIMNYLKLIWEFLSGKKTYIAMGLLFVYGGLTYLGIDLVWLKDASLWLGGLGLGHGIVKRLK